jgi:hypothetical protein
VDEEGIAAMDEDGQLRLLAEDEEQFSPCSNPV